MFSMKLAIVMVALVSLTRADWMPNFLKSSAFEKEVGPHGEEIIHAKGLHYDDKQAILASEKVDLEALRNQFT